MQLEPSAETQAHPESMAHGFSKTHSHSRHVTYNNLNQVVLPRLRLFRQSAISRHCQNTELSLTRSHLVSAEPTSLQLSEGYSRWLGPRRGLLAVNVFTALPAALASDARYRRWDGRQHEINSEKLRLAIMRLHRLSACFQDSD